ncbi:MAG: glycosyltransferase family 4 protein [Proteobacteria bacterium]|nr:glycosyltransferase family 4 protein [Pseudomonadota bacterium]
MAIQRLGDVGGQEKSTLAILSRLVASGWTVELLAFDLSDWPKDLPLKWRRLPRFPLSVQLVQNMWFMALVGGLIMARRAFAFLANRPSPVVLTIGTAAPFADVRIVQFVHGAALAVLRQGLVPYPNSASWLRGLYQRVYARVEAGMERLLLHRCLALIAISRGVAAEVQRWTPGSVASRIAVIHHAADTPTLPPMPSEGDKVGVPTVLFVGALERKGIAKALRCLALLQDVPWQFTVVGGGDVARWQAAAAALGIGARTTFLGQTPASKHFETAAVFLFPSVYEPFGLVVTEAIAHGVAPLVSRECGAMELWDERDAWLNLSAQDSDQAWALSLRRLLEKSDDRSQVVTAAQAAVARWTWDQAAAAYAAVLQSVLPAKEGRA